MRTKIVIVCLTLISLVALTASDADASVRYRSMPNFLTGHWTIRWSDGGLNGSDLKFRKRTVKSGNHNYHIKYVTKTKKNHYKIYFKNAQPFSVVYGFRHIGSYVNVQSIGVSVGVPAHGYDAMYYKGTLQKYTYKNTRFIRLDPDFDEKIFNDDKVIIGYTNPYSYVEVNGSNSVTAGKDGHFSIHLDGQVSDYESKDGTITVSSKRSAVSRTYSKAFKVYYDPDSEEFENEEPEDPEDTSSNNDMPQSYYGPKNNNSGSSIYSSGSLASGGMTINEP